MNVLKIVAILIGACAAMAATTDSRSLNLSLLDAAKKGEAALVESRLLDGASSSTRDRFGNTALIYAARGAHVETARVLIEAGANVNQANVTAKRRYSRLPAAEVSNWCASFCNETLTLILSA